jgi:4-hydroxy-L-threonine phosphate dehydrogenase PdxA
MKNKIIIIGGDPNSINSEIIYKCWKLLNSSLRKRIFLITNYKLIQKQFKILNYPIKIVRINDFNKNIDSNSLKIINIDLKFKNSFRVKENYASKFVLDSLNLAHKLAIDNDVSGIINCAINKRLLKNKMGVTEYLASKCGIKNSSEVMLIRNKKLSVCPITTHLNIKEISKKIKTKLIINKVLTIDKWFRHKFKRKPKIAILGLNPHNAEFRKNSEEKKIIIPAILKLKKKAVYLKGPFVADTIFIKDYKKFDIIVGMFHDQVLAPFKALFKFNAINITLGLKYLRVSPDHGVAIDLIRKKNANPQSLHDCINFINKFGT